MIGIKGETQSISAQEAKGLLDTGKARIITASSIERVSNEEALGLQARGFKDNHPYPYGPWIQPSSPRADIQLTPAVLRQTHRKSAAVRPAVSFLVRTLSTTPWRILADPGVSKRDLKYATDLFLRPGPGAKTFRELLAKILTDLFVLDAVYIEKIRSRKGGLVEFAPRDPATFSIIPGNNGEVKGYVQSRINVDGTKAEAIKFREQDIMRTVFYPRTDSFVGTPVIEAIIDEVSALMMASQAISSFFDEDEIPSGILHLGDIGRESWVRAQADFEGKGGLRSKRMLRTTFGKDPPSWVPFRVPFREMEIAQIMPRIERIVFRNFGVTPLDLGMSADVNRSCYSADTETLTNKGWKHYWEIEDGDEIACYDPNKKVLEYLRPKGSIYLADYEGDMVHFTGRHLDCMVTPDHRMWARVLNNGTTLKKRHSDYGDEETYSYRIETAGEIAASGQQRAFMCANEGDFGTSVATFNLPGCKVHGGPYGDYVERQIPMVDWLKFLGYWISEGHAGCHGKGSWIVSLSQKEGTDTCLQMGQNLESLPVGFNTYVSKSDFCRRWQVGDKALCSWLMENCGDYSYSKRIPDFVWDLSREQLDILYQALMDGDGTRGSGGKAYYTASNELADQFQMLAILLGHRAHKTKGQGVWRILVTEATPESAVRPSQNVRTVPYSGKVYCFSVPPHQLFFTRRNGRVSIQGNTAEAFKEIRTFTLFKPILDLLAEAFTYDVLHEISDGLFLEFQHFSRTGQESDASDTGLGTEAQPVDTNVPGEGADTNKLGKGTGVTVQKGKKEAEEESVDSGRSSPLFGGYGLSRAGLTPIICRPAFLPREIVREKRFSSSSWSDDKIMSLLAPDSLRGIMDDAIETGNTVVSTVLLEMAEEIHDMVPSKATSAEIRVMAEYGRDQVVKQVENVLRSAEAAAYEYVRSNGGRGEFVPVAEGLTEEYRRSLNELVVDQIAHTTIAADEEAAFVSAFDSKKLSVDSMVKRAATAPFRAALYEVEK